MLPLLGLHGRGAAAAGLNVSAIVDGRCSLGVKRGLPWGILAPQLGVNPFSYPADTGNSPAIAEGFVAGSVWAFFGWLSAPGDARVRFRKSLEALAL